MMIALVRYIDRPPADDIASTMSCLIGTSMMALNHRIIFDTDRKKREEKQKEEKNQENGIQKQKQKQESEKKQPTYKIKKKVRR